MGTSSDSNLHQQQQPSPQGMLPPRHGPRPSGLQTSLSMASSEQVGSPDMQEPNSNSDPGHDSATESASSRDTWPTEPNQSNGGGAADVTSKAEKEKEVVNGASRLQVVRGPSRAGGILLREVAQERVDLVAEKMKILPNEHLEEMKNELKSILEGNGGPHHVEEFLYLQKLVQDRVD
jgi:hypothetical protein